ncbi:MAG: RDD family protein [bacterium]
MENISIVLALPEVEDRIALKKMLFNDRAVEVVGEPDNCEICRSIIREEQPDLLLLALDLDLPENVKKLVEEVASEQPQTEIIIIAPDEQQADKAHKLVRLGAYDFLTHPLDEKELLDLVRSTVELSRRRQEKFSEIMAGRAPGKSKRPGKTISVFSTKGGVGRSLLAVNLACALHRLTEKRVALVDLDLQFGDDAVLMDMKPTTMIATLAKDCKNVENVDFDLLDNYMHTHDLSGVDLLPAPARPEEAEYVDGDDVRKIISALRRHYHYIVFDTSSHLAEPVIAAIESSDLVLLLLTLELPTIKNGKLMLDLMDNLGLPREVVRIVMNRNTPDAEIQLEEVAEALGEKIIGGLPSEGGIVMPSIDEGTPVVVSHPESEFAQALFQLTRKIVKDEFELEDELIVSETEDNDSTVSAGRLPEIGEKIVAGIVDYGISFFLWAIMAAIGVVLNIIVSAPAGLLLLIIMIFFGALIPVGYFTAFQLSGQPPGCKLQNLKIVTAGGEPLSAGVSFLRSIMIFVSILPLGLGLFWALWDPNQQTWHDKIAATYVVKTSQ